MVIYANPGLGWWGVFRKTTLDGGAKVNAGRGGFFREKGGISGARRRHVLCM